MVDKSPEEKKAWIDGYRAAYEVVQSMTIRVDGSELDEALSHGTHVAVSVLKHTLNKLELDV